MPPRKPAWLSEEDLLKEQAEFMNGDRPAATVVRVGGEKKGKSDVVGTSTEERTAVSEAHKAEQEAELSSVDVPLNRVMNDRVVERQPDLTVPVAPPRADLASSSRGFPKPKLRAWRSKKLADSRIPLAQRKPTVAATGEDVNERTVLGMNKEEREETMAEVKRLFSASNIEFLKEQGRRKLEFTSKPEYNAAVGAGSDDMYEGEVDLGYGNRLELDELEIDKQKWMEPVTEEEDVARQEDETFEGRRFDFEGKERYGSDGEGKYDPVLYHHGEEPGKPGYTVQELLVLSDSNNAGQRQLAIRTLGNIIANDADVSGLWIRHRQVHVRFAVSVSHANINVRHAAIASLEQLLVRFPGFSKDLADIPEFLISLENVVKQEMFSVVEEETPAMVSLAHVLALLLPLASKLQDICADVVNFAAEKYRVATCTLLLPYVDDYYRASQIGAMRVLGGLERPKQGDLDWCCAGLHRWAKGISDGTMDVEEIRSYLPVFSRYMCLHASDDDVVLHAAKVVEALWKLENREPLKRSLQDCIDSVVQKIEDKAANNDLIITTALVQLVELLVTAFKEYTPVCELMRNSLISKWLLRRGNLNSIGRVLFLMELNDDAVNELSGLVAHSEDSSLSSSSEILATLCRYGGDREVAARGLKAARDVFIHYMKIWAARGIGRVEFYRFIYWINSADTMTEALQQLWHCVGVEGPWDASTPLSVVQKASFDGIAELDRVNREVLPLLQWGDMALAILSRIGDFSEAPEVGMRLLTYPSGRGVADGDMMKWESARVELRKRIEGGVPTSLESSLMLALCGRAFPLSSRVDVWCDTDFMIVLAKTEGLRALTGESDLFTIDEADLSDRESQSLLRVWRDECQSFLQEAAGDVGIEETNLVVRTAHGIVGKLEDAYI